MPIIPTNEDFEGPYNCWPRFPKLMALTFKVKKEGGQNTSCDAKFNQSARVRTTKTLL